MSEAGQTSGAWQRIRAVAVAIALCLAAYLLIGNVLLNSDLAADLVNRQPQKFRASWSKAFTLYPGHLRVHELRIAGHIRHTVWSGQAALAEGRIAFLPLLRREVRVPRIDAVDVSGGASVIDVSREPPPPRPGGWTLRLERIAAASVRHAYLNEIVLTGAGEAQAGFVKTLRSGPMEVLPSRLHFEEGTVWYVGKPLVTQTAIDGTLAIARHLRAEAPGIRKLAKTDFDVRVSGIPHGLRLEDGLDQSLAWQPGDAIGRLDLDVGWRQGALRPASHVSLAVPIEISSDEVVAESMAQLDVAADDDAVRLRAVLDAEPSAGLHADAELKVRGLEIPIPDVQALIVRTDGHLRGQWHFGSLAWLDTLIPGSRVVRVDGAGSVLADLVIEDGEIQDGSDLKVPAVAMSVDALGNRYNGEASAELRFRSIGNGLFESRLQAMADRFTVAPVESTKKPYVVGRHLQLEAEGQGRIKELGSRFSARLRFEDAEVPDLTAYNRYLPATRLAVLGGTGRVSGQLAFDGEQQVGSGSFRISGRDVRLAVGDVELEGAIDVDTKLTRADVRTHDFVLDGTRMRLHSVQASNAGEPVATDWWSELDLSDTRFVWDRPARLQGRASMRMKDVSLLLGLYSAHRHLPGWIARIIDEGEAVAEGELNWRDDTLLVDRLHARNDRFALAARMHMRADDLQGDLLAEWGRLAVGVELANGEKDFHLRRAREWFEGRPHTAAR